MKQRVIILFMAVWLLQTTGIAPGKARMVTDQTGRRVEVSDFPKRIISLAPSITEIIFDLGCENRLKGVTTYSNFPEAAQSLSKVGPYTNPDLEKIVALTPDLCIGIKDGNPKDIVMRLESLDIPVYAVNPRSLESIRTAVLEIGELLQASQAARRLIADMESRIDHVKKLVARADRRPKVFFQIGITPIVSAGSDTFIHELIETAGGVNLADAFTSYPRFSTEEVIVAEPDVIIITSMARDEVFERVEAAWRQWQNIPAVKNDRIFVVESDLFDRPSPRLVDALEVLVELIHPELCINSGGTP